MEILLLKIALVADIVTIIAFIGVYSRLAAWWRNAVGRTIVVKDIFLLFVVALTTLSVFFHFSRLTSQVAGWMQLGGLMAMAVTMCWRIAVFVRIHRQRPRRDEEPPDGTG